MRKMKLKTGPVYYLVSALLFAALAIYVYFKPAGFENISTGYRKLFFWILVFWAVFRGFHAWMLWKRKQKNETE